MRFLLPVLLLLAACNCATAPQVLPEPESASFEPADPAPAPEAEGPPGPAAGDRHWVPHLRLKGQINPDSAGTLIRELKEAAATEAETEDGGTRRIDAVLLEIDSGGGQVPSGFEMGKAIEDLRVPVICVVDGSDDGAQSMAFWLLQSCDVRLMTRRSILMLHQPLYGQFGFGGQENAWQNKADALRVLNRALLEHACRRMSATVDQCAARVDGGREWFFDWREALRYRAVDGVVTSVAEVDRSLRATLQPPADVLTRVPPVKR